MVDQPPEDSVSLAEQRTRTASLIEAAAPAGVPPAIANIFTSTARAPSTTSPAPNMAGVNTAAATTRLVFSSKEGLQRFFPVAGMDHAPHPGQRVDVEMV